MEIQKPERRFFTADFELNTWEDLQPYVQRLLDFDIQEKDKYLQFLAYKSEFDAVIEENAAWRYIKMTIDTTNPELSKSYSFFVNEIQPKLAPFEDQLNKKIMSSNFVEELSQSEDYRIYFRAIAKSIAMFREENVPLEAELSDLAQEYGTISGAQTIEYKGEKMTLQKAALFLRDQDEAVRKEVFELIAARRAEDQQKLDDLFDKLVEKRHQVAVNAGYANFRDYKFDSLGRFDYTKEDCFNFHASIKKHIVPIVREINKKQADLLGKERLKPWDTEVDPKGREALKPFEGSKKLIEGTIQAFNELDPYFADCITTMEKMRHLDLESKNGKAPGGYNYPLYEIGVPFIFMNSVGAQKDLVTMVHEGGHAIHSFLSRNLELTGFKSLPSEVAELASMSMELLSMKHWDKFYDNEEDLKRAKTEQLESVLKVLPWIATIDEFQHWIYTHPEHTQAQRKAKWNEINTSYGTGMVDWSTYEEVRAYSWHRQLHLFEVPFYYIEYGIAQLGALSVWKNSIIDRQKAIHDYKEALKLGYSKTLPEIYRTAGIRFDFSDEYVQELAQFIQNELKSLA
ncbi:MAG: oligoendopeptidase [Crocinitomicaceae bacterium]|jgi:oligoendopeptidase F|nr:oligoendopeptidase [Crocinitomicaceae bacterium]